MSGFAVIYLDYDGLENNVFESQVLAFCRALRARDIPLLYVGYNLPRARGPKIEARKAAIAGRLDARILWHWKFPYLGSLNLFIHALRLLPIAGMAFPGKTLVFHCRSPLSGRIGLFLRTLLFFRKAKVITDYRGVHAEHYETYPEIMNPKWSPMLARLKIRSYHAQRRACCRRSDHALAVSEALRNWYDLRPCEIIRCNYDRENFNLEPAPAAPPLFPGRGPGDLVLLYSGGLQEYQCIAETLAVAAHWAKRGGRLVFLTQDRETAIRRLAQAGIPESSCYVGSAAPASLRGYFLQADFAFILRHDNIVNRVASPVKIGEYLGCGVPLLYTACTGDIPGIAAARRIGIEMDLSRLGDPAYLDAVYDRMRAFKAEVPRAEVAGIAREYFSLEDGVERLIGVYRKVAGT
jgi:hypothetical protein